MPARNSQTKPDRGFDAVAESRRWKEAVAAKTAGMSMSERMAWFRRHSSVSVISNKTQPHTEELVLREESAEYGTRKDLNLPPPHANTHRSPASKMPNRTTRNTHRHFPSRIGDFILSLWIRGV